MTNMRVKKICLAADKKIQIKDKLKTRLNWHPPVPLMNFNVGYNITNYTRSTLPERRHLEHT